MGILEDRPKEAADFYLALAHSSNARSPLTTETGLLGGPHAKGGSWKKNHEQMRGESLSELQLQATSRALRVGRACMALLEGQSPKALRYIGIVTTASGRHPCLSRILSAGLGHVGMVLSEV